MEVKFDSEAMATIASSAIFDAISEEQRNLVIKQAIEALLIPTEEPGARFGSPKTTPLQRAFNQAIQRAAYQAVEEAIKTDPAVKEAISNLLGPLVNSALAGEAENYSTTLADKIGSALGVWLGEIVRERSSR